MNGEIEYFPIESLKQFAFAKENSTDTSEKNLNACRHYMYRSHPRTYYEAIDMSAAE